MVNELIGLQLITVIWKPEGGERIDRVKADYCDMETEGGERIDRFTADYCDMET